MEDRASPTDVLLSSLSEEIHSNDDFFERVSETFGRIAATAQTKFDKLQNDLKNQQVIIDQHVQTISQNEAKIATHEEEKANLLAQLEEYQKENRRVAAENVHNQKRIDQLNQLIEEQKTNYEGKISQLRTEIVTSLGHIITGFDTTTTTDALTDSYSESAEEDEGIADNISAVVENIGTESASTSSTPQHPNGDFIAPVAGKNDTKIVDTMPKEIPTSSKEIILSTVSSKVLSSGISVHPDCQSCVEEIRMHRIKRYIIFKIDHQKGTVVVETTKSNQDIGNDGNDYEDYSKQAYEAFINDLKHSTDGFNKCCYALFDFHLKCFRTGGKSSNMEKAVFIYYCSDKAERRDKMIYASSVTSTTSKLHPAITIQATEESELSHEVISNKLFKKFHVN